MDAILKGSVPLLVSVTVCAALLLPTFCPANVRLVGFRLTVAGVVPVPLSVTVPGELAAFEVTVSVPVRLPFAVGVNVTLTVQLAPPASEVPQLLVCV